MNEVDHRAVLSIRGEAERSVPPDQVAIQWWVSTVGESKSAAMAAVTNLISVVTAGLSEISGEVLTVDTTRAALTWSTQSIHTEREYTHNKVTGDHGPTGRHHATANSVVILRNF